MQAFEFADASQEPYYADTLIEGYPGYYRFPTEALDRELFTVQEDGRLDRQDLLQRGSDSARVGGPGQVVSGPLSGRTGSSSCTFRNWAEARSPLPG